MTEVTRVSTSTSKKKGTYFMQGFAVLLGFIVILTIIFMNHQRELEHKGHLFINTIEEIQVNISEFHLWFEKHLAGNREKSKDEAFASLDIVEAQLHIMLEGGMTSHGVEINPATGIQVISKIKSLKDEFLSLREGVSGSIAGTNVPGLKEEIESSFSDFMQAARSLEAIFINSEQIHINRNRNINFFIIAIWAFAVCIATIGITLLERKKAGALEALKRSEKDLGTIVNNIGEGIVKLDSLFTILLVNEEFCKIFGYPAEELIGKGLSTILPKEHRNPKIGSRLINAGGSPFGMPGRRVEMKGLHRDGTVFPIELRTDELAVSDGEQFYTCVIRNISERRLLVESLRDLSYVDELTGLANRRSHDKNLQTEWNRAKRRATPITIIMLDIDYFKNYNDHYGHTSGDDCLRRVALALQSIIVRAGDSVARYGGEEFAAILPGADLESSRFLADTMRRKIESLKIEHAESKISKYVTISLGVASGIPVDGKYPEALVSAADDALYRAKDEGRNRVNVVDDSYAHDDTIILARSAK